MLRSSWRKLPTDSAISRRSASRSVLSKSGHNATPGALDALEPLLAELRALPGLVEKSRGVFYRGSRAFLHFHEDPRGLFADLRDAEGRDFDRIDVTGDPGRRELIAAVKARSG